LRIGKSERIDAKFGTGDYVGDITSKTKIKAIARVGKWVKYHYRVVFNFFVTQNI